MPVCIHCGAEAVTRPRGLGWKCFYTPGVKDMYPPTSKYARRGVGGGDGGYKLPTPTTALPGTPEKAAVLAERASRGEQLWHELDATYEGGSHADPV